MARKKSKKKSAKAEQGTKTGKPERMPRKAFQEELEKLQTELCHLQDHVVDHGIRAIVIFEGRDAAGKGGVIKRITERVSPRVFRVVALPAPSDRQKTQWYPQRYIEHFPAAGEIMLFDRSWYNRAGIEHVMDFCTKEEYERFMRTVAMFEEELVEQDIRIIKYFFDVSQDVQEERFIARMTDPMRHWKLSPMDVESYRRWWDYTAAYQRMLDVSDTPACPWYRVQADDKRRARLNCISHLLSLFDYDEQDWKAPKLGKRKARKAGTPKELTFKHTVPPVY
jgi:polyphosphate kinase 2